LDKKSDLDDDEKFEASELFSGGAMACGTRR